MKDSITLLNNLLKDNDVIVLAISGGPDSMALFDVVLKLNKSIKIICAHVNHKVRKQSDIEYEFVKSFCQANDIIFEGLDISCKLNGNFESEARKIRYDFFNALKNKYNANYIITAHHGDDQIETVLMRISRGSTLSGYAGLKLIDNKYIRPFLYTTKNEILEYCDNNNLQYFIDKTNKQMIHTRNRYRKKMLPFLKMEDLNIHLKYLKFSNELNEYDKFVNDYIEKGKFVNNNQIFIDKLISENDLIKRKAIEKLVKNLQKNDLLNVTDQNMDDMLKVFSSNKSNVSIDLNNEYMAKKEYNVFSIVKKSFLETYEEEFHNYFKKNGVIIKKIHKSNKKNNNFIRLDSSEIELPLIIRCKREKDVMEIKNGGHQKIKDIFINAKINKSIREVYPIVCDSNDNVLFIPGIKKSKFDKELDEKYDIILSCETEEADE